ncbi:MAG: TMEM175 family protein [Bryobacteraceae bacterium]
MKSAEVRRSRLGDVPLGKARIQSLSDAVFAFALALLILQVKIPVVAPNASRAELLAKAGEMWPAFVGFFGTFLLAGALWYLQHLTFHFIRHTNHILIWLNLVFLLFVAVLPLSLGMLIHFPVETIGHLIYFSDLLALGLMLNWHWYYAVKHNMVDPDLDVALTHRVASRLRILPSACALALPVAVIRTDLSVYAFIWVLLLEPFVERWTRPAKSVPSAA